MKGSEIACACNTHGRSEGKHERKRPLRISKHGREDDIKMDAE